MDNAAGFLHDEWKKLHPKVVCEHPRFYDSTCVGDRVCLECGKHFPYEEAKEIERGNTEAAQRAWRCLKEAERRTVEVAGGHLTVMRFTSCWKAFFGTPKLVARDPLDMMRAEVGLWIMPGFDTMERALEHAVKVDLRWREATPEEVEKHFALASERGGKNIVYCDSCGEPIDDVKDAWVEWIVHEDRRGKSRGGGLRIVHHQVEGDYGACKYAPRSRMRADVRDFHLDGFAFRWHLDAMHTEYGIDPAPIIRALNSYGVEIRED
jgi:hypothetical protein